MFVNLLREYELNEPKFKILKLIQEKGEASWDELQAANFFAIRGMIDAGLVDGPTRSQKIRAKPFSLTQKGLDILGKCERRLHTPAWLAESEHKVAALRLLSENEGRITPLQRKEAGVRLVTLNSLRDNDYVNFTCYWSLTEVGREAWNEYQKYLEETQAVAG